MSEEFLAFHRFSDEDTAKDFATDLEKAEIDFKTESVRTMLDSTFIGESASPAITIKLRSADFEKAHAALRDYYKKLTDSVDKDYYLFGFSNEELFEIIARPDEWGYFDNQLAQKILNERGQKIDTAIMTRLKENRITELAKPENDGLFLVLIGYGFLAATALASRSVLWGTPNLFPGAFIVCSLLGRYLAYNKKVLPDGQTVFAYSKGDRDHGKAMITISLVLLVFSICAWLYNSPLFGGDNY